MEQTILDNLGDLWIPTSHIVAFCRSNQVAVLRVLNKMLLDGKVEVKELKTTTDKVRFQWRKAQEVKSENSNI